MTIIKLENILFPIGSRHLGMPIIVNIVNLIKKYFLLCRAKYKQVKRREKSEKEN